MNQNLHVNKTNFHIKGFALGLTLRQRRKTAQKSLIITVFVLVVSQLVFVHMFVLMSQPLNLITYKVTVTVLRPRSFSHQMLQQKLKILERKTASRNHLLSSPQEVP